MKKDISRSQNKEERGLWAAFFQWLRTPFSQWSHFSRSDPRIMLILILVAVSLMIFGDSKGLMLGSIMLWFLFTFLFPALCGQFLSRRFGENWGLFIAFAPLWLPLLLVLTEPLWMPLIRGH